MANKVYRLKILTPTGQYFVGRVESMSLRAPHSILEILPGHISLVTTINICDMSLVHHGHITHYALGGGVLYVKQEGTILLVNSIERFDEIDVARAQAALLRANERLASSNPGIDKERAELAKERAETRLKTAKTEREYLDRQKEENEK